MAVEPRELELIDYLDVVWRWKWLIAVITVMAGTVALVVGAVSPSTYKASGTFTLVGERLQRLATDTQSVTAAFAAIPVVKLAEPGAYRIDVSAGSEADARQGIAVAMEKVAAALADPIRDQLKRVADATREQTDLRALAMQLRESRVKNLERNDAVGLIYFQTLTTELARLDTRLRQLEPIVDVTEPRVVQGAIGVTEMPGVPLRLMLFVVLFGALVFSTLLAFLIDYVRSAVAIRRTADIDAGRVASGSRG